MSEGLIPEDIRGDLEAGVAAALDEPDLREALVRVGIEFVPDDVNDIDLILMLVPRTHGASWPHHWQGGSDTFGPFRDGYVLQTIRALDVAAGCEPRQLDGFQADCLARWLRQSAHENS